MLTAAERNALILTLAFLLSGAGIKLWIKARVELGPFAEDSHPAAPDPAAPEAPDTVPDSLPEPVLPAGPHSDLEPMVASLARAALPEAGKARPEAEPASRRADRAPRPKAKSPPAEPIDVNRAGPDELAAIPGIGPATALAIVAFREERGVILGIRELLQVKGIGEKKLGRIAPHLRAMRRGEDEIPRQAVSQTP